MAFTPDRLDEGRELEALPDGMLVRLLAKRFTENSVVMQLATVSAEEGTAYGVELLLRPEIAGERSPEVARDSALDAMITEARRRIAARVSDGAYTING